MTVVMETDHDYACACVRASVNCSKASPFFAVPTSEDFMAVHRLLEIGVFLWEIAKVQFEINAIL
jgi:hypothetical protein